MVRMALTEPQTALAGVMLKSSFVRLVASMATFSKDRVFSRRFGRCGFVSMFDVEATGRKRRNAEVVREVRNRKGNGRPFWHGAAPAHHRPLVFFEVF